MRFALLNLVVLTVLLGAASPVALAQVELEAPPPLSSVRINAHAGFDGEGRLGTWLPFEVELINEGSEIRGTIQVSMPPNPAARTAISPSTTVYSLPVVLPKLSHKRFALEVNLPGQTNRLIAKLVQDGTGVTLAETEVTMTRVALGDYFCGVIARDPFSYDFLGALELPAPIRRVRLAPLEPPTVPEVAQLLGSFDCIILDNAATAQLRQEQLDALQVWVGTGGLLIAVGGSTWQETLRPLPADLLPVDLTGLASLPEMTALGDHFGQPLTEAGPWLVAQSRVRTERGDRAIVSQGGMPLMAAGKRGEGTVIFLAFEPTARSLKGWAGSDPFWRYVMTHASVDTGVGSALVRPYLRWGRTPRAAMNDFSADPDPSLDWLWGLAGGYAVLMSGTLLLLTRRGMVGWSVVAAVTLTVGATFVSFQQAVSRSDSTLAVSRVTVVRPVGVGQGNAGYTREYVSVLAKRDSDFEVELDPGALARSLLFVLPRPGDDSDANWALNVSQEFKPSLRNVSLKQGQVLSTLIDGQVGQSPSVQSDLRIEQGALVGTITNRTGGVLRDAYLVINGEPRELGTLAADETRAVDSGALPTQSSIAIPAPNVMAGRLLTTSSPRSEVGTRRDVLEALFFDRQFTRRMELRGPTLVGWLANSPTTISTLGTKSSTTDSALLVQGLQPQLPRGFEGEIPATAMNRKDLGLGLSTVSDRELYVVTAGESVSAQFLAPPSQGRFELQQLRVNVDGRLFMRTNRMPQAPLTVSLFNWQAAEWQTWEVTSGANSIPEGERYLSAVGEVRARFSVEPQSSQSTIREAQLSRFDVTLVGMVR